MPTPLVHALAIVKQAAALVNKDLGELEPAPRRCHLDGRRGRGAGQVRRRVPARRLADRFGHPVQHEHERGPLQPRQRAARRQARQQEAGAPERPRQSGPVLERRLPDGHAHRGGARDRGPPAPGAPPPAQALSNEKAEAFKDIVKIGRTHLQDATPGDARPGILRLCDAGRARRSAGSRRPCPGSMRSRRAAPRSARASTRIRNSPSASPRRSTELTALPFTSAENKFEALASQRRARVHARRAGEPRHRPVQDRQRHPPDGLRPALRARRDLAAGERAGLIDHARQGQSDPGRGHDHAVRPGGRQPDHRRPSPAARAISSSTSSSR